MKAVAACTIVTMAILTMLAHAVVSERAIGIRRASPAIALAPADLFVEVLVTPHPDNREVRVSCVGPEFARASAWSIEGMNAPTFYRVEYRSLPSGEYDVAAVVRSSTQERGRALVRVLRK